MTPQIATLMAEYNRWMNERVYEAAARLDPSGRRKAPTTLVQQLARARCCYPSRQFAGRRVARCPASVCTRATGTGTWLTYCGVEAA